MEKFNTGGFSCVEQFFFFVGLWVLCLCLFTLGGSPFISLEFPMFVRTRILSYFWRMPVLKHHSEVKDESVDSGCSTGLCLSSFLKD